MRDQLTAFPFYHHCYFGKYLAHSKFRGSRLIYRFLLSIIYPDKADIKPVYPAFGKSPELVKGRLGDDSYWISRTNCLELIELSSTDQYS
jgi:hypothetical protein